MPPELIARTEIVKLRNQFVHGSEDLDKQNLIQYRDVAVKMIDEIVQFLRSIEDEGIYPRIVTVESFVTDSFGRKYIYCRNERGHLEKVFTNVPIDPSRHYFFHPTHQSDADLSNSGRPCDLGPPAPLQVRRCQHRRGLLFALGLMRANSRDRGMRSRLDRRNTWQYVALCSGWLLAAS